MEIDQFKNDLAQLKNELGLAVDLSPLSEPEGVAQPETSLGYKLCLQGEDPSQMLILILDQSSLDFDNAKSHIKSAILNFWDGRPQELKGTLTITH